MLVYYNSNSRSIKARLKLKDEENIHVGCCLHKCMLYRRHEKKKNISILCTFEIVNIIVSTIFDNLKLVSPLVRY